MHTRPWAKAGSAPDPTRLDLSEHLFDTGWVEYVEPKPPWEAGRQGILNGRDARMPEHTFKTLVPVVARIVWERDGEEQLETEALGWLDQNVCLRLPDPRHRFTAVWLNSADARWRG
jgi:hypothetical protein